MQLEQAFLNLILNAAEAMPDGGSLTIRTRALESAQVSVSFKDTGGGMTPDQQQRAFKTVLSTTKIKGTGIGLAIVGRTIETHHGQIRISSRPGRGTTMRLTLPVE
jgi:signal transduction histidine kinase